ncbi:hypothetical protein A4D02_22455 [Niastella koreensis]|uniref:Uncharacterized protein n=2 Tax=Niastella koreensis TaxID=354356 RepID=G8TFF5_NIAKG|nr:hypothetical protein [Niastella koreensis]AEV98386.1 hypothetical protein Niako_2031 [Niastella koreensis GR20-10]OQP53160.1 hypothetical protein A4D02_22455 [Niastella koreensis]
MALIDDFIKNEESKMSLGDKLFMNYPKVRSTTELTDTFQHLRLGNKRVIKTSLSDKVIAVVFLLFIMWFAVGHVKLLFSSRDNNLLGLGGLVFVLFMISLLLRNSFFNKKYIFTITVDYEGISIDTNKFSWTAIDEIYLMSKHEGKRTNYYLLIFEKDTTIKKFDLYKFSISSRKLSTIIEYYRTGHRVS